MMAGPPTSRCGWIALATRGCGIAALAALATGLPASAQLDPRRGPPGCVPVSERQMERGSYILVSDPLHEHRRAARTRRRAAAAGASALTTKRAGSPRAPNFRTAPGGGRNFRRPGYAPMPRGQREDTG